MGQSHDDSSSFSSSEETDHYERILRDFAESTQEHAAQYLYSNHISNATH